MIKKDNNTEIYENKIEELFYEYFEQRGIDLNSNNIKQTKFNACWKYIYNILFKPEPNTTRRYNAASKLDYNNIDLLNRICDIYIDLCFEYNIAPFRYGFCRLTGINEDTLHTWKNKECRAYIYYDKDNNLIDDIVTWKLHNKGEYRKEPTSLHSDLIKKLDNAVKEFYRNNLSDTPVGQITLANNDDAVGLLYAQKEAQAHAQAWGVPQQSREQIAERYKRYEQIPEKPDLN